MCVWGGGGEGVLVVGWRAGAFTKYCDGKTLTHVKYSVVVLGFLSTRLILS